MAYLTAVKRKENKYLFQLNMVPHFSQFFHNFFSMTKCKKQVIS